MKTKNIIISIFSILTLISCKNESDKKEGDQNQAELKETFDVNFNLTISKDDTFQLYYTEDGTLNFGDDRSVKSVVKGGEAPQDVLFKLPADVFIEIKKFMDFCQKTRDDFATREEEERKAQEALDRD